MVDLDFRGCFYEVYFVYCLNHSGWYIFPQHGLLFILNICSYLKSLLPSFNECTNKLLEGIRPLADGKTIVPMKEHLSDVTLAVISKVFTMSRVFYSIHSNFGNSTFQVAFGSDFSKSNNDATAKLKWVKGNGKLTFLVAHAFKGLQRSFAVTAGMGYQVSTLLVCLLLPVG